MKKKSLKYLLVASSLSSFLFASSEAFAVGSLLEQERIDNQKIMRQRELDGLVQLGQEELLKRREEVIIAAKKTYEEDLDKLSPAMKAMRMATAEFDPDMVDTSKLDDAIQKSRNSATVKIEPVAVKVEPVAVKIESVAVKIEPVAVKVEPVAVKTAQSAPPPPPPPMVKKNIFAEVNAKMNDKSLSLAERFSLLFATPQVVDTHVELVEVDTSGLMSELNSDETPMERLRRIREAQGLQKEKRLLLQLKKLRLKI